MRIHWGGAGEAGNPKGSLRSYKEQPVWWGAEGFTSRQFSQKSAHLSRA